MRVRVCAKLSFFILSIVLSMPSFVSAEKKYDPRKKGVHCASFNGDACCTSGSRPTFWCVDPSDPNNRGKSKLPQRIGTCRTDTLKSGYYMGDWFQCPKSNNRWELINYDRNSPAFKKYKETSKKRKSGIRRGGKISAFKKFPVTSTPTTSGNGSGSASAQGSSQGSSLGSVQGSAPGSSQGSSQGSGSGNYPPVGGSGGEVIVMGGSGSSNGSGSSSNVGSASSNQASGSSNNSATGSGSGTVGVVDPDVPPVASGSSSNSSNSSSNGSGNGSSNGSAIGSGSGNVSGQGSSNNNSSNGSGSGNVSAQGSSNNSSSNGSGNNSSNGSGSAGSASGSAAGTASASSPGSGSASGSTTITTVSGSGSASGNASGNSSANGSGGGGSGSGSSDVNRSKKPNVKALSLTGGSTAQTTKKSFYDEAKAFHAATKKLGITEKKFLMGSDGNELCYTDSSAAAHSVIKNLRQKAMVPPIDRNTCREALHYLIGPDSYITQTIPGQSQYSLYCNRTKESLKNTHLGILNIPETNAKFDWNTEKSLGDFDGDNQVDITGAADQNWTRQISSMKFESGDHFLLSINGDGGKIQLNGENGESVSAVLLSNTADSLKFDPDRSDKMPSLATVTPSVVRNALNNLKQRGVTVHVNVIGGSSGGFVQELIGLNSGTNPVCAVSDSDANTPSFESDVFFPNGFRAKFNENLGVYGNQLEALACSLAEDTAANAMTTLDEVTRGYWNANSDQIVPVCTLRPVRPGDQLQWEVEQIIEITEKVKTFGDYSKQGDASVKALREKLLKAFETKFVGRLRSCLSKARSEETLMRNNIIACKNKITADNSKSDEKESVIALSSHLDPWLSKKDPIDLNRESINRNIKFIKESSPEDLEKYKSAFCCLSFDLKKGESDLELCR